MNFNASTRVRATSKQVHTRIEDECVILALSNSVYYGLDPVGTEIWEMIQEPITVDDIITRLTDVFDITADECRNDVLALLQRLAEEGLIEEAEGTTSDSGS